MVFRTLPILRSTLNNGKGLFYKKIFQSTLTFRSWSSYSLDSPLQIDNVEDYRKIRKDLQGTVGFVPTMGSLHEGHLSLVRQAKKECDHVVASIYVNPLQFAAHEDLDDYPRPLESDISMLNAEGVDIILLPNNGIMYPGGDVHGGSEIEVKGVSHQREGAVRPHFFKGVATVVCKLLHIAQPDILYLGQKDAQQAIVIRKMLQDLLFPVSLTVGDTVREPTGLAMSSRNEYLTTTERTLLAPLLYKGLKLAADAHLNDNVTCVMTLISIASETILKESEGQLTIQYINIDDALTLQEMITLQKGQKALLSGAVLVGKTRIIDNILIN